MSPLSLVCSKTHKSERSGGSIPKESLEPQAGDPAGYSRCHKLGKRCTADLLYCRNDQKNKTAQQMMCESCKLLSITSTPSPPVQCVPEIPPKQN